MTFHELEEQLTLHFNTMYTLYGAAFRTNTDKDELWNTYIESFPAEVNPIYRTRREFDCSCCRHFIKEIGGIVFIDSDLEIHTLWEFKVSDPNYQVVLDALDTYVRNKKIVDVYLSKENWVGTSCSRESDKHGDVKTWEHFYLRIPEAYQLKGRDTLESVLNSRRTTVQVFNRSLSEISLDAIDAILDLIVSNTLYKGAEWKGAMAKFKSYKEAYDRLPAEKKILYSWKNASEAGDVVGRIRNHSIGVLLTDISEGVDLNEAVSRYERIVAPSNYKRPKPIFTAKMLEDARNTISELGYLDSLPRRYARLDDISVSNILFANRDANKRIQGGVFDELLASAKSSPKKFDRVEEIPIDKFISDVLPNAKEIEAYVENRHAPNMVSLIAPVNSQAPSMFKWDNGFSWAYSGNIADSDIRKNVKAAGGGVDGVLRFSIQWNDGTTYDGNDLDAHCIEPAGGSHIYYMHKHSGSTGGELDVDIINPTRGKAAVENITWPDLNRMFQGEYEFFVHAYCNRGGREGFKAEIEFDNQIYRFEYPHELRQGEKVKVATVTLRNGKFTINEQLPSTTASRELWGVKTTAFTPVSIIMYSPNYWDGQNGIGNKHYMFMLKGCTNPERPNGFYNEFLKPELTKHKRVFEALGNKLAVEQTDDQLSGLGFSSTLTNDLIIKVKGTVERVIRIKF